MPINVSYLRFKQCIQSLHIDRNHQCYSAHMSHLQDHLPSSVTTFQYVNDTTMHKSCGPAKLQDLQKN